MDKCIVMSDLHLVSGGALCNGIDTAERLHRAIEHINGLHSDAALCVLAGDLTDTGDAAAYDLLRGGIEALRVPVVVTLGNHDDRAVALQRLGLKAQPATGRMDHVIPIGAHLVVVLDTLWDGQAEGIITPAQLTWLGTQLEAHSGGPVVVVTHHNPAPLGVPTDPIGLSGAAPLLDLLIAQGGVRQVISGHVHCTTSGLYRGLPCTTIAGNTYNMVPLYGGTLDDVIRTEGPGQIGVVLMGEDGVIVHHESFFDANPVQSPDLHRWPPGG